MAYACGNTCSVLHRENILCVCALMGLILMICVTICVMNCCGEILRRGSLLLMNVAYLHFLFML